MNLIASQLSRQRGNLRWRGHLPKPRPKRKPTENELGPFRNTLGVCLLALIVIIGVLVLTGCSSGAPPRLDCPETYLVPAPDKLPVPKDNSEGAVLVTIDQTHDIYFEFRRRHLGLIRCVRVYQGQAVPRPEVGA